jgi:hypothetical protein
MLMILVHLLPIITLAGSLFGETCIASNVGLTTVEQPINLGVKSDPARIPLGTVGVVNNYNYGIHSMIGAARACPDGAMQWDGGSELDQNLASVFGITVDPEDSTNVPGMPVILNVKSRKPPGYSPYTKEQVLAATLWCLLRSAVGTPQNPLDIRVIAEGKDDKHIEAKFSGKYVTRPGRDGKEVPPVEVTGTVLEVDALGITWVRFPSPSRPPPAWSSWKIKATGIRAGICCRSGETGAGTAIPWSFARASCPCYIHPGNREA